MTLIAWSQNMTPEGRQSRGALLVSKDHCSSGADILTIPFVLTAERAAW